MNPSTETVFDEHFFRNRDKVWLSKANAHRLTCAINIELRVPLRAIGVDEASQAEALKKLLGSKSERIHRNAIREIPNCHSFTSRMSWT